ncbi:TlpA family protein disulfide reductase [Aureispira anguillae]|uniref:TlpA family protein disulfide reductase n=1 Tax=Aureispira anguillae TaxID=2864201 RepID=A0A915YD13_9BACT|nr:TlpA disulfide reductase family protein [Aureispira anguillae]BDS10818.1 TlpA family protein disulfide reductase [Aureispira anguillae]
MKYLRFFFLLIAFYSCTTPKNKISYTILSGTIKAPTSDSLYLYSHLNELERIITLDKEHHFRDTITGLEGYYYLIQNKRKAVEIFLKPAFDLDLVYDPEMTENVTFKGKGAVENNYLRSKVKIEQKLIQSLNQEEEREEKVVRLSNALENGHISHLNGVKDNIDKDFEYLETQRIDLSKRLRLASFKKKAMSKSNLAISDSFSDPFEGVGRLLENEKLLLLPNYLPYIVSNYIAQHYKCCYKGGDLYIWYIQTMDSLIQHPKIKDEAIFYWKNIMFPFLADVEEKEGIIKAIQPILSNIEYKQKLEEELKKLKKNRKGAVVEPFELYDENNNLISLQSLRGKLVYIDIWATWCGPCKKQIPHLEQLQKKFEGQDIYFVSISYNDNKKKWKKMVTEENMGGIQLFAPDSEIPFLKNLAINGIPRFVLLDKEGKILEAKAKSPSNPEIIPYLEQYLKREGTKE